MTRSLPILLLFALSVASCLSDGNDAAAGDTIEGDGVTADSIAGDGRSADAPLRDGPSTDGLADDDGVASDGASGPRWTPGGGALRCDDPDDAVIVDLGDRLANLDDFTVELWYRAASLGDPDTPKDYLLHAPGPPGNSEALRLAIDDLGATGQRGVHANVSKLEGGTCSGARGTTWLEPPALDRWTHVAMTVEERTAERGARIVLFVDGARKIGGAWPDDEETCVDSAQVVLCRPPQLDSPFGASFDGWLDEVRVSAGIRYVDPFRPAPASVDADTLLLLDFEAGVADTGPHALPVTVEGTPEVTFDRPVR